MRPKKSIIGIDPGFSGAVAFISPTGLLFLEDLPLKEYMGRKEIDGKAFGKIINRWFEQTDFAVLEDVSAMPGQGVTSMFRFGFATGLLLGVLNAYSISVIRIKPSVWKPALGLTRNKDKSLALARKIFKGQEDMFKLKKHDGRAEAALMAHYIRENF